MTPRQMRRFMYENGFELVRSQKKHLVYSDGITTIPISSGQVGVRNVRNYIADVKRALKKRPPEAVKEKPVGVEQFNKTRPEAHPAPGIVKPLSNGNDVHPEPEKEPVKRKKYDMLTKRKLEGRIIALYDAGHHEVSDIHRALVAENFPDASGNGVIGTERVRYFLYQLLEGGVIKQVVVAPKEVAAVATSRKPGRLPDTVMGILTDPELTAEQKVRMLMAYAEM